MTVTKSLHMSTIKEKHLNIVAIATIGTLSVGNLYDSV
jgi:hypothetical protein